MERRALLSLFVLALWSASCREVIPVPPELPPNPFAGIGGGGGDTASAVDSSSFLGLHTYVFAPSCAVPGCHDGSFEPDFRTVESAYRTLVYHPVEKNDPENSFTFRVVPGDRSASWLWERVTTDDAVLGRMPLYDTLTPGELAAIRRWIDNGAPDVYGNQPLAPDYRPAGYGFVVLNAADTGIVYNDDRPDPFAPIPLPRDTWVTFWLAMFDFGLSGEPHWTEVIGNPRVRVSDHPYAFDGAAEYAMATVSAGQSYWAPPYFFDAGSIPYRYRVDVHTGDFPPGRVHFVRFSGEDGEQPQPTVWPDDGTPVYILNKMSFVVP